MAKDRTLHLTLKVDGKGEIKATSSAIRELSQTSHKLNESYGEFDRRQKSVAGNTKNATSGFAKQAQGRCDGGERILRRTARHPGVRG